MNECPLEYSTDSTGHNPINKFVERKSFFPAHFSEQKRFWQGLIIHSRRISLLNSGGRYPGFLIEWIFYWIWSNQIKNFEYIFELNFPGKKDYWIIFWIKYSWKKLYWIILWNEFYREMNEWIIFWIDICHFWWKAPFFVYFGHFLGNFWALSLFD